MAQCLAAENLHGIVVKDFHRSVGAEFHQAVMAVGIVGIQGYVRHDGDARHFAFERVNGARDEAVRVAGFAGVRRFFLIRNGWKKIQRPDAQIHQALGFLHQSLDAPARTARQGGDGLVPGPFMDEDGIDEMFRGKGGFPDKAPDVGGFSVAARPYR